jgi:predicted MFS family arabinose efflux permease
MTVDLATPPRTSKDLLHRSGVAAWLLVGAVGLAFADASIVVLALPRIYARFDTTIVGVSWVLTAYAVIVTVVALGVAAAHRWMRPLVLVVTGLGIFALASVLCGFADSLSVLMAGRCVQGVGAALLLTGSLPILATLLGETRARMAWSYAATVGLAIGPALGGLLTEVFDWRAIFLIQAPIAVAALAVAISPAARTTAAVSARGRPAIWPNLGLLFLSGGLVGALFLSVLLVIEVWRFSPIVGAAVVTALPAGMLLLRRSGSRLAPLVRLIGGALLLGGGLVGLAWLPAVDAWWAVAALALCGAGLGLLTGVLDEAALRGTARVIRNGSLVVGARHAGLVLGLVLIAPVLAGSLDRATERSALAGAGVVLDARVLAQDKLKITFAVRDRLDVNQRGAVPDLEKIVAEAGVKSAAGLRVGDALAERIEGVLTRAFRPAFGVAAVLGFAVLLPGLVWAVQRRRNEQSDDEPGEEPPNSAEPESADSGTAWPSTGWPSGSAHDDQAWADPTAQTTLSADADVIGPGDGQARRAKPPRSPAAARGPMVGLVALLLAGGGLLVAEQTAGTSSFGSFREVDACTAPADPYPGGGLDAGVQRIALSTINGAACELHVSRERLVLALDGKERFGSPRLDRESMERALRAGLIRATDDAQKRGDLPGWLVEPLRSLAQNAPLSWLLDQLGLPGG